VRKNVPLLPAPQPNSKRDSAESQVFGVHSSRLNGGENRQVIHSQAEQVAARLAYKRLSASAASRQTALSTDWRDHHTVIDIVVRRLSGKATYNQRAIFGAC
jgi:hypothetical protein